MASAVAARSTAWLGAGSSARWGIGPLSSHGVHVEDPKAPPRVYHPLAERRQNVVVGGSRDVVKRLAWTAIGWFVAFGFAHGPAGGGIVMLVALAAMVFLGWRERRVVRRFLPWAAVGALSLVVPLLVGEALWPQRCTPTGCTVWPPEGSAVIALLSNGGLALLAVGAAAVIERYRQRPTASRGG